MLLSLSRGVSRRLARLCAFFVPITAALAAAPSEARAAPSFTTFESGQVRPLALSADKKLLYAVNTPDNHLEVYRVHNNGGLQRRASIPVGLEPVAVAARGDDEVWVVNHLSDSVSVVKIGDDGWEGRVVRTLLVGDEPRDIVFAGQGRSRAFITTAHRGQNNPHDPELHTPGIGRADVWVFDGNAPGGDPLSIITLFTDTPRALAVSPDGDRVYAAGFHSGNRTTTLFPFSVDPSRKPGPYDNADGVPAPQSGIIVQFNGQHWVDETGAAWDDLVALSLPDKDVFVLDAKASPPKQLSGAGGFYTGVGTVLFNMAVNPQTGKVYVSNVESRNLERFEGPGEHAGQTLRGHLAESRISVLGAGGAVARRHLNKHVDYGTCCAPVPNAESETSLAFPLGMAVSKNGSKLYVAALGSSKIGVYDTAALEADTFVPNQADQIEVSGGGPTGVVLDDERHRLYVLTRFDNGISVINTTTKAEIAHHFMHNPEPPKVVNGRRFLYDARHTSSHGDSACASCHIFGDFDSLAWDLGNPDDSVTANLNAQAIPLIDVLNGNAPVDPSFHPMKGPMTTQSLRGMANHGPMHWRGDRTGSSDGPSVQPGSGTFDERAAFKAFNPAFQGLLGRSAQLSHQEMEAFTDFILEVAYPPNPVRALDNALTPDQAEGQALYFSQRKFDNNACTTCHVTDFQGNPGEPRPGFFGTSGLSSFEFQPQIFKVPHLRNLYQKVGMFGMSSSPAFFASPTGGSTGDQVRGFGYLHDGSIDTLVTFVSALFFTDAIFPEGLPVGPDGDEDRRKLADFLLTFDTGLAPIVGQQITLTHQSSASTGARIDLLIARANVGECDLIAKYQKPGGVRGYYYSGAGSFYPDRAGQAPLTDSDLRALASQPKRSITYTCTPPGSGVRMGVDRDEDGVLDGDEIAAGSDPADPNSTPNTPCH